MFLGAVFTFVNARLPILRNSLVYARTAENIELHHLALWQVCSDASQVHAQGCGFSVLALPFARFAGLNVGLKLASWLATALMVLAMVAFFRRFAAAFGLGEADVPLALVVACFNPLTIAQFWSAHADSAFAALFLISFVWLDRLLRDEVHVGLVAAYTASVMLAVFTRPAGLILYPLHAIHVLWYRDELFALARERPSRLALLVASAVVLGLWVGLGKLGRNPLVNLNQGEYHIPVAYLSSVAGMVALIAITIGVLAVVALPKLEVTRRSAPLLIALVIYIHVLMVFHASVFNLRYFVPVVPFMALPVVRALRAMERKRLVAATLAAYALSNGAMILAFNVPAANRLFMRVAPDRINWDEYGHFDNLRMAAHLRMKEALARIDAEVPAGAVLYYVSPYYDGAADGIYQGAGMIRPDIRIRYARSLEDAGPLPAGAWIFFPEAISRQPGDPPGKRLETLVPPPRRAPSS